MACSIMTSNSFVTNKQEVHLVKSLNNNNAQGDMNDRLTMKQIHFVTQSACRIFYKVYSLIL